MTNTTLRTKNALIIGTTGNGPKFAFGGSDKIKGLENILKDLYKKVSIVNTFGWSRNPFQILLNIKRQIINSDDVYIVLSVKGTKYLCPYIARQAKKHKARLLYAMVGIGNLEEEEKNDNNWEKLTRLIQNKSLWHKGNGRVSKILSRMDAVMVEAELLKEMVESFYGLNNVFVLENGRDYPIVPNLNGNDLSNSREANIHFVYFASVVKAKGADLLLDAAEILLKRGINNFDIDIYGRLSEQDKTWFKPEMLPNNISYKGVCLDNKLETLRKYDCLIFPSKYIEGMPGTIVDARFAGLPVIASTFTFAHELVLNRKDGLLFDRGNAKDLADKMNVLISREIDLNSMKKDSLKRAYKYNKENMEKEICKILNEISR